MFNQRKPDTTDAVSGETESVMAPSLDIAIRIPALIEEIKRGQKAERELMDRQKEQVNRVKTSLMARFDLYGTASLEDRNLYEPIWVSEIEIEGEKDKCKVIFVCSQEKKSCTQKL